jgi:pyridinium-3,5-bisthiocarboxylic acid mononucleotide nickel chelatase
MKILYMDCFSGISGDMILGALVDAGLPADELIAAVNLLGVDGIELSFEKVTGTGALSGTRARVVVAEHGAHRHLPDILRLIDSSRLESSVKECAGKIFQRLAEAEAAVHGVPVEKIHFHEVGALDAIVDIVGAAAGLNLLGIERVCASPLHFGTGTVECRHGTLPVPVPAVARLAEGFPARFTEIEGELTTPTGAAILTTVAHEVGVAIDIVPESTGYGFGTRERAGIPNALRVILGRTVEPVGGDRVYVIETNVDDISGQVLGFAMERAFAAGALDVFFTPIQMKKNRPGNQVSAICEASCLEAVRNALLTETGSLGIRISRVERATADRETSEADTSLGKVRIKRSRFPGCSERVSIEYDDLARLAREHGIPLKKLQEELESEIRGNDAIRDG